MARYLIAGFVIALIIVGVIVIVQMNSDSEEQQITNFEECVAAGNAVMESYPRQCRSGAQVFVEEIESDNSSGTQPTGEEPETSFVMDADDDGYYINGEDIDSIAVPLGSQVDITFNVKTTNVYSQGLEFEGCGFDSGKVMPGKSTKQTFTMENTCTITSSWPSTNIVKDTLQVMVD